jgi:DNA polymerase III delta prime subunit
LAAAQQAMRRTMELYSATTRFALVGLSASEESSCDPLLEST